MILKYQYEQAKKQTFLSFWQINDIESYYEKAKDFFTYLSYFAKLSHQEQRGLVEILLYAQKNGDLLLESGQIKVKNQKRIGIPISKWSLKEEEARNLDDVHFISIVRDRSLLNTIRDVAYLTKDVLDFFTRIHFYKNHAQIAQLGVKSLKLPELNKTLSRIGKEYLATNDMPNQQIKKLLNRPEIIPCISPQYFISLYLSLEEETGIKPIEGEEDKKPQERLAYLVHYVDAYLCGKKTRYGKFLQEINEKHLRLEELEKEETSNLIKKLSSLKIARTFHRLPFWHKFNVLFRLVLASPLDLAESLLFFEAAKV